MDYRSGNNFGSNFQFPLHYIQSFGSNLILTGSESNLTGKTGSRYMNFSGLDPDPGHKLHPGSRPLCYEKKLLPLMNISVNSFFVIKIVDFNAKAKNLCFWFHSTYHRFFPTI